MSDQVWYYSQHGEKQGPVTLEVLQSAIEHGKIDPSTDLVWGPGLSDWVKVHEVPALQVSAPKSAAAPPPPSAVQTADSSMSNIVPPSQVAAARAAENPYASPGAENALQDALNERRAGNYPGMGRLAYFLWNFVLYVATVGAVIFLLVVVGGFSSAAGVEGLNDAMAGGMLLGLFAVVVIAVVLSIVFAFSRLQNLAMSRWNYLWSFIPIANIWLAYRMIGCPAGYHEHKQLDTAGKVVRVFFILYIILSIVAPILMNGATYYRDKAQEAERQIEMEQSQ
ncbi:GYF domain-containing protein [Rubritalea spongiae]|uniref:GYF domain-containing protein n=1 Tax=Rubritalea spongiae TaxID=430797 RepID=A0ABW5E563_9BACT